MAETISPVKIDGRTRNKPTAFARAASSNALKKIHSNRTPEEKRLFATRLGNAKAASMTKSERQAFASLGGNAGVEKAGIEVMMLRLQWGVHRRYHLISPKRNRRKACEFCKTMLDYHEYLKRINER